MTCKSVSLRSASTALAAVLTLAGLAPLAPAVAEEITIEGNIGFVSDYRFRGVSLSDEAFAVQGGFDLALPSGLYVGTWASSIEPVGNSEVELDLYGGYGFEASGLAFDIGVLGYFYPGAEDVAYGEVYGSVGKEFGALSAALGFAYAPEQDNLGDDDNTYVYLTGDYAIPDTAITLNSRLGWEDGVFGDDKIDWLLGATVTAWGLDWGLAYIDTSEDFDAADATGVLSVSKAF